VAPPDDDAPLVRPVSAALALPTGRLGELARFALAVVDRVHLDGELPRIPIDRYRDKSHFEGQYRYKVNSGRAQGIGIDPFGPVPEFAVLHEIGHFLDHQALGKPGAFASNRHPDLEEWRRAVRATRSYLGLRELREKNPSFPGVRFLLKYTELWARSYSQYVAVKSQNTTLLQQLANDREHQELPYNWAHWEDDDFAPIVAVIDRLLRRKGWLA
jgi:hypothetical protein